MVLKGNINDVEDAKGTLVRLLWCAFQRMWVLDESRLSDADMELWAQVTKHPAIQEELNRKAG